jgi:hypothetical protein
MQTITSRDVQSRYGEFVESVQDDLVCVTRHGRRLFWAVSDRQVSASDPSKLIGRLLLLNGQLNRNPETAPSESFATFLERDIDPAVDTAALTPGAVTQIVDDSRRN